MQVPSRCAACLSQPLSQRLNAYALAAGAAGVGMLALSSPAEARIVFTSAHRNIGSHSFIDLNHDGIKDFKFTLLRSQHCSGGCTTTGGIRHGTAFTVTSATLQVFGRASANQIYGQGKLASALPAGVRIGRNGKFPGGNLMAHANAISGDNEYYSGAWAGAGTGVQRRFLGLKFTIHGKIHFGWARLNVVVSQGAVIKATLTGYAYETTPNKGLLTGQKKEASRTASPALARPPATLGMLALGAQGVSTKR